MHRELEENLTRLNVDRSSGHPKPHKVCLLLAVMDLIQQGQIQTPQIQLTAALEDAFKIRFKRYQKNNDKADISLPFYHLKSEPFWNLIPVAGTEYLTPISPSKAALKSRIKHAEISEDLFNAFNNPITRLQYEEALTSNLENLGDQFARWLIDTGRSEKTAKNYVQALRSTISKWTQDEAITERNLLSFTGYESFSTVAEQIADYDTFKTFNKRGKGMYSAALNNYREFLRDISNADVQEDIQAIYSDVRLHNTERAILINARIGQGQYRKSLIDYWGGCAVTGYADTRLLIASHIKPWKKANNAERLDRYNGLLLQPNLDKAFDLGYISFTEKGKITISEQLEQPAAIGIDGNMAIDVSNSHQDFLSYHRECVYQRG